MRWDRAIANEMFPSGYLPNTTESVEDLVYGKYDVVSTREYKSARNMVTEIVDTKWYPTGDVERIQLYDVYPFPFVDNTPLLSVYGGKMVQNWLQLDYYHNGQQDFNTCEKKETVNDVGFNYTGL